MPSILFVCLYNACRSQIAEAICRSLSPDSWTIASIGLNPSDHVDPKAVKILRRHRLAMNSAEPKGIAALHSRTWDYVVNIAGQKSPLIPAQRLFEWDVPDPNGGPMKLYEALYEDLARRVRNLLQEIQESPR